MPRVTNEIGLKENKWIMNIPRCDSIIINILSQSLSTSIIITANIAIIAPSFQNSEDQDLQNNFANCFLHMRNAGSYF
jgi:hypothetical protein